MNNFESIESFVKEALKLVPDDLSQFKQEWEENLRAAADASFKRMNLVTREEFDVQNQVLSNTRKLVEELEQQIQELEQKLNQ